MRPFRCIASFCRPLLVGYAKYHRYKHQRCNRREDQSAYHRASQWGVLLAALAKAKRHRNHADDHRQRRHQNGAEAHEPGFDRRRNGITKLFVTLAGKLITSTLLAVATPM